MKLVYLSNIYHHLQSPLSEELYKLTGGSYAFVETGAMQQGMAYKGEKAPFVMPYNEENQKEIEEMVFNAEVVIFGEAPMSLIKRRINAGKLTFRDDERRYKKINRYLKWPIYTYYSLSLNKGYLLCASAFGSRDYHLSGMSLDKCFKWGYFPTMKEYENIETILDNKKSKKEGLIQIFWTGRMIKLKHPESTITVAKTLKDKGIKFIIKIVGDGPLMDSLQRTVDKEGLGENVKFLGLQSPEVVRALMEESDIYLFTSDRGEGWGAVLNESLNSACAVVASPASGSAPFLIKENENGLFFKDKDWKDLSDKVVWLVNHPKERLELGRNAYRTMLNVWRPEVAARNFLTLVKALQDGRVPDIKQGPCSRAEYLPQNWFKY